ncbi:dTMP kinase [Melioribacteraceae bacterium 4301-Me]|uniref:dTMP kinase n=1 Tax=Pyranulibacter aquaticus TaxID=3163344 RepID=UPI0035986FAA
MFISFEGLDFCGKSTQVKLLEEYLRKKGNKVKVFREPGGTNISEKIREILLDKNNTEMSFETELLLFAASRAQLVKEAIIPSLSKGYYVISDRFHDSSVAYQGYGRGIDLEFITNLQNFIIKPAVPNITFLIDIPVEEVLKRKSKIKQIDLDRIELSEKIFYEKVRRGYFELSKKEKRFIVIDGLNSIETINQQIVREIEKYETK